MESNIHSCWVGLVFSLILTLSNAVSLKTRENLEHAFDLGTLSCCPTPTSSLNICTDLPEFIPCTIANEMEARETSIKRVFDSLSNLDGVNATCVEAVKNIQCSQNFPACVTLPSGDLEVRFLLDECDEQLELCPNYLKSSFLQEGLCLISNSSYPVDNCEASSPEQPLNLLHCTIDWYLPKWIHQYSRVINSELNVLHTTFMSNGASSSCWAKYRDFRCQSVGKCWAQGDRLEGINTLEACREAVRCIPDSLQHTLAQTLRCDSLPSAQQRLSTQSTPISHTTEPVTEPPTSATTTTSEEVPTPGPIDSSSASRSASILVLTLLILGTILL